MPKTSASSSAALPGPSALDRHAGVVIVVAVAAAIGVRLLAVAFVPAFRMPQTFEHEVIANNVLAGVGFQWTYLDREYLSMRPLFVYLCVVVYALTGHSHVAMLVVQALIAAATVAVTAAIARHAGGGAVAALAAVAIALEPGLLAYDVRYVHPLGFQTLLFALQLLTTFRALERPTPARFALAGLALGAAVYERGTALFFAPVAFALAAYGARVPRGRLLRLTAVALAVATAVHVPWLIRNWTVYGEPVFIMTAAPSLLWIGNNPDATGTAFGPRGAAAFDEAPTALRARVRAAASSEHAQMDVFREEVARFWRAEPGAAVALSFRKLLFAWWFSPQSGIQYPPRLFLAYKVVYAVELAAAIVGTIALFRSGRRAAVLALVGFLLVVSAAQSAFFVEGRHRLAMMPALLVLSAVGVAAVARLRGAARAPVSLTREAGGARV